MINLKGIDLQEGLHLDINLSENKISNEEKALKEQIKFDQKNRAELKNQNQELIIVKEEKTQELLGNNKSDLRFKYSSIFSNFKNLSSCFTFKKFTKNNNDIQKIKSSSKIHNSPYEFHAKGNINTSDKVFKFLTKVKKPNDKSLHSNYLIDQSNIPISTLNNNANTIEVDNINIPNKCVRKKENLKESIGDSSQMKRYILKKLIQSFQSKLANSSQINNFSFKHCLNSKSQYLSSKKRENLSRLTESSLNKINSSISSISRQKYESNSIQQNKKIKNFVSFSHSKKNSMKVNKPKSYKATSNEKALLNECTFNPETKAIKKSTNLKEFFNKLFKDNHSRSKCHKKEFYLESKNKSKGYSFSPKIDRINPKVLKKRNSEFMKSSKIYISKRLQYLERKEKELRKLERKPGGGLIWKNQSTSQKPFKFQDIERSFPSKLSKVSQYNVKASKINQTMSFTLSNTNSILMRPSISLAGQKCIQDLLQIDKLIQKAFN